MNEQERNDLIDQVEYTSMCAALDAFDKYPISLNKNLFIEKYINIYTEMKESLNNYLNV